MVNGSKVYNVRFYSLSIIQRWKKQRGRGKGGKERRKRRKEVCVQTAVDVGCTSVSIC